MGGQEKKGDRQKGGEEGDFHFPIEEEQTLNKVSWKGKHKW